MIKVKFSPGMQAYKKLGAEIQVKWQEETIGELLGRCSVDNREIGIVLVNGSPKKFHEKLEKNSEIYVLPLICGG